MSATTTTSTGVDTATLAGLRRGNLGLSVLHAPQAVAVLLLASESASTRCRTSTRMAIWHGRPGSWASSLQAERSQPGCLSAWHCRHLRIKS